MSRRATIALVAALALVAAEGAAAATTGPGAHHAKVTRSAPAAPGAYPAQVGILLADHPDDYQAQYCGGTLVDPSWVLTAAHCFRFDGEAVDVLHGSEHLDGSGTRVRGTAVLHPDFDIRRFPRNDIALVRLRAPVDNPVAALAVPGMEALEAPGTLATVTGWGRLSGDHDEVRFPTALQEATVPVLDDDDCDAELNVDGRDDLPDDARHTLLCAGAGTSTSVPEEADACRGDSGGPLWAVGPDGIRRQIGIVSGGPTCGRSPTYYTAVQAFTGFIEGTIGRELASFADIRGNVHERNIEATTLAALTSGFPGGTFRPGDHVSRGQIAAFVARALRLAPVAGGPFSDVEGTLHAPSINAVAAAGIVGGLGDGTYRPDRHVTRAQLATIVARALRLPAGDPSTFPDAAASPHAADIGAVAAAGIVGGFGDGTYRPERPVSRDQMATFLANAFLR